MIPVNSTGEIQSLPLTSGGICGKTRGIAGMPDTRRVANLNVAEQHATTDVPGGGVEVFQKGVKSFE
jgi:hypothetical protein